MGFPLTPSRNAISIWLHFQSVTRLKMAVHLCTADALNFDGILILLLPNNRSVAIVRETRNGVRPISGAKN